MGAVRAIQEARGQPGLDPGDKIAMAVFTAGSVMGGAGAAYLANFRNPEAARRSAVGAAVGASMGTGGGTLAAYALRAREKDSGLVDLEYLIVAWTFRLIATPISSALGAGIGANTSR